MNIIYFDMDGTLADFYQGAWLHHILVESATPYAVATELVSEETLLKFVAEGYELGIISWTAKNGTKEYNSLVRQVKKSWLRVHYPNVRFSEIHIVKYGTPKWSVVKDRNGILYDDEERNLVAWRGEARHAKLLRR